jgi:hypothetical protein
MLRLIALAAVIIAFLTAGAQAGTTKHTDLKPQPPMCANLQVAHDHFPGLPRFRRNRVTGCTMRTLSDI